ncbi:MAG TPA: LLM class F420-dependent oxidoreductase [Acidimicrobiales bacterium]|nr:LLM class F420-dependent oxidoreductase [Acidimicrobiales bacterium]
MRIGAMIDVDRPLPQVVEEVRGFAEDGLASAWGVQIFAYDALTLLAVVGAQVPGIELGTGVVPVHSRHPQVMAQQALTVQAATGGRLTLGVGLSHKVVVEGLWGMSYDRPARYLREYLEALVPMLAGSAVDAHGEVVTAVTPAPLEVPDAPPPPVLVAALGPVMLGLAGRLTDGTITWMTGVSTVGSHVVPTITEAATAAGRPRPRVAVSLPVTVTADVEQAKADVDQTYALYATLPSYQAMLQREGAKVPSDVAILGDEASVRADLRRLADAGATDFLAAPSGSPEDRRRTLELLSAMAREG